MTRFRQAAVISAAFIALVVFAAPAAAAIDWFIKIEGIKGAAVESQHRDWIAAQDLHWGAATAGGGAGKSSVHEVTITKERDNASPSLFRAVTTGQHFPQIVIEGVHGRVTHRYVLDDAIVASVRTLSGSGRPLESVTLHFTHSSEIVHGPVPPTGPIGSMPH